jgi:hypothetical protein
MAKVAPLPAQAYVYVIAATDGPVKVGIAKDVASRRAMLQTGNATTLHVAHKAPVARTDALFVERYAHDLLSGGHIRGEWFNVDIEEAVAAVEAGIEALRIGDFSKPAPSPEGTAWQHRLRRAGLTQVQLARLAGVNENAVSSGLRGLGKRGVPIQLRNIIRLWEMADRTKREAILADPDAGADV